MAMPWRPLTLAFVADTQCEVRMRIWAGDRNGEEPASRVQISSVSENLRVAVGEDGVITAFLRDRGATMAGFSVSTGDAAGVVLIERPREPTRPGGCRSAPGRAALSRTLSAGCP
jgi:hypothetical protein